MSSTISPAMRQVGQAYAQVLQANLAPVGDFPFHAGEAELARKEQWIHDVIELDRGQSLPPAGAGEAPRVDSAPAAGTVKWEEGTAHLEAHYQGDEHRGIMTIKADRGLVEQEYSLCITPEWIVCTEVHLMPCESVAIRYDLNRDDPLVKSRCKRFTFSEHGIVGP